MSESFESVLRKRTAIQQAEKEGSIADSQEVRIELMRKLSSGEMTLAEVQAELKKIKRGAKKAGKITRSQAWNRG
jgi:hypothetical protein